MEQSEAEQIVARLRIELAESRLAIEAAERRAAALESIIEGYVELFPDLAEAKAVERTEAPEGERPLPGLVDKPRGQDAVLRVMESIEFKGRYWAVPAMVAELGHRDWLPDSKDPARAVRTALDRLAASNPRVIKGRGATGSLVWYYEGHDYPAPILPGQTEAGNEPSPLIPGATTSRWMRSPSSPASPGGSDTLSAPTPRSLSPGRGTASSVDVSLLAQVAAVSDRLRGKAGAGPTGQDARPWKWRPPEEGR